MEVLVDADVVLLGVVIAGTVEIPGVENRQRARNGNVVKGSYIPCSIGAGLLCCLSRKRVAPQRSGGGRDFGVDHPGHRVFLHQSDFGAVGRRSGGEGHKRRIFEPLERCPVRRQRKVRLIADKEEELFVRNHRPSHGKGHVVDVIWIHRCRLRDAEFAARRQVLILVVFAGQSVELIGSGLGGHRSLNCGRAAIINRISIDLNAYLLQYIRVRRQVKHAGTNGAGHIHAVHDVLVTSRTLSAGTGVHPVLRSEVGGGARPRRVLPACPGNAGRDGDDVGRIPARQRQVGKSLGVQRLLEAAVRGVDQRSLGGDRDRGCDLPHDERKRDVAHLVGGKIERDRSRREPLHSCRYRVVARRDADETVNAGGVADCRLRNARVNVRQGDLCLRNNSSFLILHSSLDSASELRIATGCRKQHHQRQRLNESPCGFLHCGLSRTVCCEPTFWPDACTLEQVRASWPEQACFPRAENA